MRDEVEHETGPVLRGNLRYLLPDLTVTGDARWTTASAEDNHFSGSLGGFYTLPRGTLRGRIYQRAVGNSDRQRGAGDRRDDRPRARDQHGQPDRPRLRLGDPGQPRGRDTDEPDITRTDFIASYAYDLTASVTAEVGYNYQTRDEDPIDTDSHRVFLVLGKTFETGL